MEMNACEWLRQFLRNGPKEVSEIRNAARKSGYSKGALREAKRLCRVTVSNNWNAERGQTDEWFWSLPEDEK